MASSPVILPTTSGTCTGIGAGTGAFSYVDQLLKDTLSTDPFSKDKYDKITRMSNREITQIIKLLTQSDGGGMTHYQIYRYRWDRDELDLPVPGEGLGNDRRRRFSMIYSDQEAIYAYLPPIQHIRRVRPTRGGKKTIITPLSKYKHRRRESAHRTPLFNQTQFNRFDQFNQFYSDDYWPNVADYNTLPPAIPGLFHFTVTRNPLTSQTIRPHHRLKGNHFLKDPGKSPKRRYHYWMVNLKRLNENGYADESSMHACMLIFDLSRSRVYFLDPNAHSSILSHGSVDYTRYLDRLLEEYFKDTPYEYQKSFDWHGPLQLQSPDTTPDYDKGNCLSWCLLFAGWLSNPGQKSSPEEVYKFLSELPSQTRTTMIHRFNNNIKAALLHS